MEGLKGFFESHHKAYSGMTDIEKRVQDEAQEDNQEKLVEPRQEETELRARTTKP